MWSKPADGLGRSAAWRLALPGIAVVALGSAAVMAAGFGLLSASIRSRGDAWLAAEVASIAATIESTGRAPAAAELEAEVHELELHEGLTVPTAELEREGLFFLVLTGPGGRVAVAASRGPRTSLTATLAALPSTLDSMTWVHPPGVEYPVRVVVEELADGRRMIGGATPYADAELLEEVREVAVLGWLLMVAVAVPVTWLAVRRVLRRVDHLAEVAATISADELARRLPVGGERDEIDRLAATFNALLDRAARAATQLRTVSDTLAHDLRTPLARLRGDLEDALRAPRGAGAADALRGALADLDGIAALLEATLDAAEADAGALRLHRTSFDLAALIRELLELYEPAAAEHSLTLVDGSGPAVTVAADRGLLQRALVNLLDNALAHLPAGSRVTVAARRETRRIVLEAADDGPGFPPEIREHAFDRSVRGPGSAGRGLGLALVRAVAVAHGGRATLEQPPTGGSVIRLELPPAPAPEMNESSSA